MNPDPYRTHMAPQRGPAKLTPFPLQETRYAKSLGPMLKGTKEGGNGVGSGHGEGQAQGRSGLLPAAHRWFRWICDGWGREGGVHIVFLSAESLSIVELVVESSVVMYRTIWRGVGS
jgi:hypothetical protein